MTAPIAQGALPLTYDRFVPGESLGSIGMSVDNAMLDHWHSLYGYRPSGETLPLAFAPLILVRAMLTIVAPRPPGNLHVGQTYRIDRMPGMRQSFVVSVSCVGKEIRKERRIVELEVTLAECAGARPIVSGRSTMFWAQ